MSGRICTRRPIWQLGALVLAGCGAESMRDAAPRSEAAPMQAYDEQEAKEEAFGGNAAPASVAAPSPMRAKKSDIAEKPTDSKDAPPPPPEAAEAPAAKTRAWFPETFLFEPLVVTDAHGDATVMARVPDRLTSWRVLALAHDRQGHQAGAVSTFLGTLPTYVDPRVPAFLVVGDKLRLPIAAVNTTDGSISTRLVASAEGGASGALSGALSLGPHGSATSWLGISANSAGIGSLRASLDGVDAVVHSFPVHASGKPVSARASGTLAAPRAPDLSLPQDASKVGATIQLALYPGALSLIQSEIAAAGSRGGAADDAYSLLLAGRAPALLKAFGEEPDASALRDLRVVLTQRALRHTRAPSVEVTGIFAEAALANHDNLVLGRLGERLLVSLCEMQRPDGTFGGEAGWTVDRLLAMTAEATRAAKAGLDPDLPPNVRAAASKTVLRAGAAFERLGLRAEDPYTAAAVLASGAVTGKLADTLRGRVRDAIEVEPDGSRVLRPTTRSVRADGQRPGLAEATAMAALALQGDAASAAWLPDLGSAVLGAYRPSTGWGDGRASQTCLLAVQQLFRDAPPDNITVTLRQGDTVVLEAHIDQSTRRGPVLAEARLDPKATGAWSLSAEPATAGLGYMLSLNTSQPWPAPGPGGGVQMAVSLPDLRVNEPANVLVRTLAPASMARSVRLGLPVGAVVDEDELSRLVDTGTLLRYDTWDGGVELDLPAPGGAGDVAINLLITPTLAGTLHGIGSALSVGGDETSVQLPPQTWTVR